MTESYRKPLQNSPADLLPSFAFEGTEEDWEQQQLIEAVRARRRAAKRERLFKSVSPTAFITKWRVNSRNERAAAQEHS